MYDAVTKIDAKPNWPSLEHFFVTIKFSEKGKVKLIKREAFYLKNFSVHFKEEALK